jgi:hypothetical protein
MLFVNVQTTPESCTDFLLVGVCQSVLVWLVGPRALFVVSLSSSPRGRNGVHDFLC